MDDYVELRCRIDRLSGRVAAGDTGREVLRELELMLGDGYAGALRLDARGRRLERDLGNVATSAGSEPASDFGSVLQERLKVRLAAAELRNELAGLRAHFVRLGGTSL